MGAEAPVNWPGIAGLLHCGTKSHLILSWLSPASPLRAIPETRRGTRRRSSIFPSGLDRHDGGFVGLPANGAVAVHDEERVLVLGQLAERELAVSPVEVDFLGAAFLPGHGDGAGDKRFERGTAGIAA